MDNNINSRLADLRKALGISQASFAEKIGISPNNISRYESGNRVPAENTILLICKTFDVDYNWLKNGDGEMFIKAETSMKYSTDNPYIENDNVDAFTLSGKELKEKIRWLLNKINDEHILNCIYSFMHIVFYK